MKNKKSVIILLGIVALSMFLFTPSTKAMLDYEHRREYDRLAPNQSTVIWFSFLYSVKPFHWEFTTILDDMQINVTLATQHSDPYWIETWVLSSNKTHDFGVHTVPYSGINEGTYQLYFKNVGNTTGYIMADLWIDRMPSSNYEALWELYVLPENRTELLWEWQSRNNFVEYGWGTETHFQADEFKFSHSFINLIITRFLKDF